MGYNKEDDTDNETYRRVYGVTKAVLLKYFRREKGYSQLRSISLTELKEFTYRLVKGRSRFALRRRTGQAPHGLLAYRRLDIRCAERRRH